MNIHLILQMAADAMGYREAVVLGDTRLTFEELADITRKVAGEISEGQRLAYFTENHPIMPAALFGAALAGTQFVPMNY